jgi:hypothetical protein
MVMVIKFMYLYRRRRAPLSYEYFEAGLEDRKHVMISQIFDFMGIIRMHEYTILYTIISDKTDLIVDPLDAEIGDRGSRL